jgi:hypothetical protein
VEIYMSAAAQVNVANMTKIGRVFPPEYTGTRLQSLVPAARLLIPTPGGGTYRLAANEGCFAYTPRAAGVGFFAVVDSGATVVIAANSAATAYAYNPVGDPVRPHAQFVGFTPGGQRYVAYTLWADGQADWNNSRPDIPVLADADKNGVPHVFVVTEPVGGLPPGPRPCLFAHHGGEGEYQLFLPGVPARANMSLTLSDGIVVTPDDSFFSNIDGTLERTNTGWYGYTPDYDPFNPVIAEPPSTATVVNYTQRRIYWVMDWLLSGNSPYMVDPSRIAAVGHSGGGRGMSTLSRTQPDRYCATVVYTPATNPTIPPDGRIAYLHGSWEQNLDTNLTGPDGDIVGYADLATHGNRISASERDFPLTRYFFGKRDEKESAAWSPAIRDTMDFLDDTEMGIMIFWDEREHAVEKWDNETDDANDDHPGPWPDVGQWIAPVRTRRASGQYLVDTYRNNRSYPGFFHVDVDPATPGLQPDPGPGDPDLGAPWGTWGGYMDWDNATMVDTSTRWECTVYAAANQLASIDRSPATQYVADVAPRRTQNFNPAEGTTVYWYLLPEATNVVSSQGIVTAGAEGEVKARGLTIARQDITSQRLYFSTTPLCLGQTAVSNPQSQTVCPTGSASFRVQTSGAGPFAFQWQYQRPGTSAWVDLADGPVIINGFAVSEVTNTRTQEMRFTRVNRPFFDLPASALRVRCIATNACGAFTSQPATMGACLSDYNCDGGVDGDDVIAFFADWDLGLAPSDVNQDGGVDGDDVIDFFFHWDRGC